MVYIHIPMGEPGMAATSCHKSSCGSLLQPSLALPCVADELDKVDDSSDGAGTSADAEAAGESDWAV